MNRVLLVWLSTSYRQGLRYRTSLLVVLTVTLSLAAARAQYLYSYDNGTANAFDSESGGDLLALNHFDTGGSPVLVTRIGVYWSPLSQNFNPTIALYSDPSGDGNPSDMQPILIQPIYLGIPPGAILVSDFQYYSIPPTVVDGSFFVGAYVADPNNMFAPMVGIDTSGSGPGQSWRIVSTVPGLLDLQNPLLWATYSNNLDTSSSGNYVIDAVYTPIVPEPSTASLIFLGGGILFYVRRLRKKRGPA